MLTITELALTVTVHTMHMPRYEYGDCRRSML